MSQSKSNNAFVEWKKVLMLNYGYKHNKAEKPNDVFKILTIT